MRRHELPDMLPGETNAAWCARAAGSIPAEELMRLLVNYLMRKRKWSGAWSFVGDFTGHGSGVSGAIVKRFLDPEGPDQ